MSMSLRGCLGPEKASRLAESNTRLGAVSGGGGRSTAYRCQQKMGDEKAQCKSQENGSERSSRSPFRACDVAATL